MTAELRVCRAVSAVVALVRLAVQDPTGSVGVIFHLFVSDVLRLVVRHGVPHAGRNFETESGELCAVVFKRGGLGRLVVQVGIEIVGFSAVFGRVEAIHREKYILQRAVPSHRDEHRAVLVRGPKEMLTHT